MRLERLTRTHSEHGHARPLTRSPRWASASVKAKCRVVSAWKEEGTQMVEIRLNRAYEKPAPNDGLRVLVERLWPRGLSKERAAVDLWMKDIAPSPELRRWFNHDPAKWDEFQRRYRAELHFFRLPTAMTHKLGPPGSASLSIQVEKFAILGKRRTLETNDKEYIR